MTQELTHKRDPQPQDGSPAHEKGLTHSVVTDKSAPRLPNERDESSDSQRDHQPDATGVGKKALADVERGVVDTTRGIASDETYERVKDGVKK